MPFTKESAVAAGKQGGKASGRARSKSPEERAREAMQSRTPTLARELLKAALGQGPFAELEAKERVKALVKALEWGLGRPSPTGTPKPSGQTVPGFSIAVTEAGLDPATETTDEPEEDSEAEGEEAA